MQLSQLTNGVSNQHGLGRYSSDIRGVHYAGPTVIVDQQYDNESQQAVPETPQRCTLVYPCRNTLAVFNGCLGHGVLEGGHSSSEQRITLLINWWAHKPQVCASLP